MSGAFAGGDSPTPPGRWYHLGAPACPYGTVYAAVPGFAILYLARATALPAAPVQRQLTAGELEVKVPGTAQVTEAGAV